MSDTQRRDVGEPTRYFVARTSFNGGDELPYCDWILAFMPSREEAKAARDRWNADPNLDGDYKAFEAREVEA